MDKTILAGLMGIIGTVAGIVIGDLLAYRRQRRDELYAMRLKAYADFIRSASRIAVNRRTGKTEDETEELVALNDAKCRIIVSADVQVVKALIDFWKPAQKIKHRDIGGTLETESEIVRFNMFCHVVRNSLKLQGEKQFDLIKEDLRVSDALFHLEPSKFSYRKHNNELTVDEEKNISCASPAERPEAAA